MERIESAKFYTNGIPMWNVSITYVNRLLSNKIELYPASFDLPENGYLEIGNSNHEKNHVQVIRHTPKEIFKTFQCLEKQILPGSEVHCHILGKVIVIATKQILRIGQNDEELQIWRL